MLNMGSLDEIIPQLSESDMADMSQPTGAGMPS